MRKDFSKILTEQPRYGSSSCFGEVRHCKVFNRDDDYLHREGMKNRYGVAKAPRKTFGEFLSPLRRYLFKQIGRKWDDVYGEIKNNFDTRKVTNQHIFEHIYDFIQIKDLFYDESGVLCIRGRYGRPCEEWKKFCSGRKYAPSVFVDPKDGIIKRSPAKVKEQTKTPRTYLKIGPNEDMALVNGVWFIFTWEKCNDTPSIYTFAGKQFVRYERYHDLFTREDVMFNTVNNGSNYGLKGEDLYAARHRPGFVRSKKRSASKKDIKKYLTMHMDFKP